MKTDNERIVVLHVILSLEIGGMEQMVADLVSNTDRRRFEVIIACLQRLGPIGAELRASGITVIKVPDMTSKLSFLHPAPLIEVMRACRARVVHVHSGCWYKTAIAAMYCGITRIVYTEHGRAFPDRRPLILADRLFARLAGRVVAVSQDLADYLRDVVRVPDSKLAVILNGVDLDRFPAGKRASNRPLRIGVVARLAPVKDLVTLLFAIEAVVRRRPEVELQVVGDGPERQRLEMLTDLLGIRPQVRFLGFRRDIPQVMAALDIFVLSSLSEGTSMTILEAMAAGKPVVATRVGGTPALVDDGVSGLLVAPGAPSELAAALLRLVEDAELRRRLGEAGRAAVSRNYSLEAMTHRYELLYAGL